MKSRIINKAKHSLPGYSAISAAGKDIPESMEDEIIFHQLERKNMNAGLFPEILQGYETEIHPPGRLVVNKGVTVLNSPGTINADYRDEVCVILINLSGENFVIKDGRRAGLMVIAKH